MVRRNGISAGGERDLRVALSSVLRPEQRRAKNLRPWQHEGRPRVIAVRVRRGESVLYAKGVLHLRWHAPDEA